ncbi:hypothetical protein V3C99_012718 [Haemonchus contortus]
MLLHRFNDQNPFEAVLVVLSRYDFRTVLMSLKESPIVLALVLFTLPERRDLLSGRQNALIESERDLFFEAYATALRSANLFISTCGAVTL